MTDEVGCFHRWGIRWCDSVFLLFLGHKRGRELVRTLPRGTAKRLAEQARQAAPRSGAFPMVCSAAGGKFAVFWVALLPSRAARKLVYVSSMKVFDRRKRLMARLCRRAPDL